MSGEHVPAPLVEGVDPDDHRAELIAMGATVEDADASVAELVRRQQAQR